MTAAAPVEALAVVEWLTRELAERDATIARLEEVADAAVAYVTEPEGSDEIPMHWDRLETAVRALDGEQP